MYAAYHFGNVRRLQLHRQEPQQLVRAKVDFESRQPSTVVVKHLFNRSDWHWSMDNSSREVPLPRGTMTTDTTLQCRWFV